MPQKWEDAIIKVLYKDNNITECRNYGGISLVVHSGKVLLKAVACRRSDYCKGKDTRLDDQHGFRPPAIDSRHAIRHARFLLELGRKRYSFPASTYTIYTQASVDRGLLWDVLARVGVLYKPTSESDDSSTTTVCTHTCGCVAEISPRCSTWSSFCVKDVSSCRCCCRSPLVLCWGSSNGTPMGIRRSSQTWCTYIFFRPAVEGATEGPDGSEYPTSAALRMVWCMICADDDCCRPVRFEVCKEFGLTVSTKKAETMRMPIRGEHSKMFEIKAAEQEEYAKIHGVVRVGGCATETRTPPSMLLGSAG